MVIKMVKKTRRFYKIYYEILERKYNEQIKNVKYEEYERITDVAENETEDLLKLFRISKKLHRLYEAFCCRDLSNREEKAIDRLEKTAENLAKKWGWSIRINADPRGAPIKLDLLGGDSVDYLGNDTDLII